MRLYLFILLNWVHTCFAADLWVDAVNGHDNQDGLTPATALQTLQAAADRAVAATLVHIQPGIYRESVRPLQSGTAQAPIHYRAEQGLNSVFIRGAESGMNWQPLAENTIGLPAHVDPQQIVWTDLSAWALTKPPRFIMDSTVRYSLAREPDKQVHNEWQQDEFWWTADGGSRVADCYPPEDKDKRNCDQDSRSTTQLTDSHDDTEPVGIEPGNLTTLGELTGATLVALDTVMGDTLFRRTLIAHDVALGQVTVDEAAERNSNDNLGLGWGSQYYLEHHPALLDTPGEYWFDKTTGIVYLWPLTSSSLNELEISRRDIGWDLTDRSHIILEDLVIEFFNDTALKVNNNDTQSSHGLIGRQLKIHYAQNGLVVQQQPNKNQPDAGMTSGLILEHSEIGYMDSSAILLDSDWILSTVIEPFAQQAAISNTLIRNNEFHHIGFHAQRTPAIEIVLADKFRFENNRIHDTAFDGIQFSLSWNQAAKTYDFSPEEIKTGEILLKDNLIETACQMVVECGGVVFWGLPPKNHVFKDVLLIGNTLRAHYGWSTVAQRRNWWADGYFGFGLLLSNASGIHGYGNLLYNNGYANVFATQHWRDGVLIFYNNLLANSFYGINIWNPPDLETHGGPVDSQFVNNLIINNERFGVRHSAAVEESSFKLDHNLYYANGWSDNLNSGVMHANGERYYFLAELQEQTPWEVHGVGEAPRFFNYDYPGQHQKGDLSVLDFGLSQGSAAIQQGSASLPLSLQALLNIFALQPQNVEPGDIGPFAYSPEAQPPLYPAVAKEVLTEQPQATAAQFSSLITTGFATPAGGQRGNGLILEQHQRIKINGHIIADPQDIGQRVELALVAAYTPAGSEQTFYFKGQQPHWLPWDQQLTTLLALEPEATLPQQFELLDSIDLDIYEGNFEQVPGHFVIYYGYHLLDQGIVVFNGQQPIEFNVH